MLHVIRINIHYWGIINTTLFLFFPLYFVFVFSRYLDIFGFSHLLSLNILCVQLPMFSPQLAAGKGSIQNRVKPTLIREREPQNHLLDKVIAGGKRKDFVLFSGWDGSHWKFQAGEKQDPMYVLRSSLWLPCRELIGKVQGWTQGDIYCNNIG